MKHWQKGRNYRKYKNDNGSFRYVITIDGADVEVIGDIYKAYSQADRRERYCAERDIGRVISLDCLENGGDALLYQLGCFAESAEDAARKKMNTQQMLDAFGLLDVGEQRILEALILNNVTEREYAEALGISQKGVNKRKYRALEKIRKSMVLKTPILGRGSRKI